MYRISDRVIAIQMAIDGADFIEVYRFFLKRNAKTRGQAFEDARRVFRGEFLQEELLYKRYSLFGRSSKST